MRKLATIRNIKSLQPIPGADKIELATVDGWELVVSKDEFKVGDLCVYFEVDSILPKHEVFGFMESRKYRVKTAKFRKQISQGLALPTEILKYFGKMDCGVGEDVTDIIGVVQHSPNANKIQIEKMRESYPWWKKLMLRYKWTRSIVKRWERKSTFPTDIVAKTDESRYQNLTASKKNFVDRVIDATEKLDGSSSTYIYRPNYIWDEFMVCSRNVWLKNPDNSKWWTLARRDNMKAKLRRLHTVMGLGLKDYIVLQGEIVGPGTQKNKYGLSKLEFRLFNLKTVTKEGRTLYSYEAIERILAENHIALLQVPLIETFVVHSIGALDAKIASLACRKSALNPKIHAEGTVGRCRNAKGLVGECTSFKYINPNFLLKYDNGSDDPDEEELE